MVADIAPVTTKLLVTIQSSNDGDRVRSIVPQVLAEYPNSLLVQATAEQRKQLESAKFETAELEHSPIQIGGLSFAFHNAAEAEKAAPLTAPSEHRTAYYVVKAVGPIKSDWIEKIRALGGVVHAELSGFSLLIGILPSRLGELRSESWVEGVTPYRPTMKVAASLRPGKLRNLDTAALTAMAQPAAGNAQQVEITVFRGESTAQVAATVRAANGTVIKESQSAVTALVPPHAIDTLSNEPGVQAILPHSFAKLRNNLASPAMGIPPNHTFDTVVLTGQNQIVGIADSGLDTGKISTLHPDIHGRVLSLVSFPTPASLATYVNDPPGHDDGASDVFSGHGTHVAGSVLGNGAAAATAKVANGPNGTAPAASLVFQAVEQQVHWKSRAQLIAGGISPSAIPDDWPPEPVGLYGLPDNLGDLFQPAYLAGVRIHTNSWGSNEAGLYTENARQIDEFLWNHRDMLILVAGGNDGADSDEDGVIDGGSIGPPATAKNCLSVGACENNRPHGSSPTPGIDANWNELGPKDKSGTVHPLWPNLGPAGHVSDNTNGMAAFSSRGPTVDGRIKPDIVAPGTNILSVRSSAYAGSTPILWGDLSTGDPLHGHYCWSGGTSMSTPLVAGAVALIRQHLVQNRHHVQDGVKPSGALLKALIVNGATSMNGGFAGEIPAGRNSVSGFGRVDVLETLLPIVQVSLFDDDPAHAVSSGEMRTFSLTGVNTSRPLKVTLVWTDAPGLAGNGNLVNKLYLQVVAPGGAISQGDASAYPNAVNNVQQVVFPTPTAGMYQIRVRGVSVTRHAPSVLGAGVPARQDFALAVSNGTNLTS